MLDPPLRMGSQHSSGVRELNSRPRKEQSVQACMGGCVLTVATERVGPGRPNPRLSPCALLKRGGGHLVTHTTGDTG